MKKLMLVTTTQTYANKAKDILLGNNIKSEIKKLQGGTAVGCLYGVIILENDYNKADSLLKNDGIRIISVKEVPS